MKTHVLISGAGPVGLVSALKLSLAGLKVTVFESAPTLNMDLRASTFHPPTLDMMASFGLTEQLIEQGLIAHRGVEAAEQDPREPSLGFGEPVMDPKPFLSAHHEPILAKVGEMTRDCGLWKIERFHKVADTDLVAVAAEKVQQAKPHGVGECLEDSGRFVECVGWFLFHASWRI